MKQNRILNYIGAAGLLLAVCACGKEDLNTTVDGGNGGAATALPEGTFVVDYSVSDGETSRAFEGNLQANERISSLLYLLYDLEGRLVKEREIPGIGKDTKWPLERENMSWEQREALKDTLNEGSTYTAVFLANVKKELFGKEQATELLQNKDNLTDAILYLPQTPFKDSNMYYLWKDVLKYTKPENASDDSRDNPLSKKIILRRLVSRIDIERVPISEEMEDEAVKTGIGENFDDLLEDGLNSDFQNKVNSLKIDGNITVNNNCENLLRLLKEKVGTKNSDNTIAGDNYDNFVSLLVDLFKSVDNYSLLVSPWAAFNTSTLDFENMHNFMSISDLKSKYNSNLTSPAPYAYQVINAKTTWIGFSCEKVKGITFSGGETSSLELAFEPKSITLGKNEKVSFKCNPIGNISYNKNYTGKDYIVNVCMSTYFNEYLSWDEFLSPENGFNFNQIDNKETFITSIENIFAEWNKQFTLSIKIPTSEEFTYTTTIEQTNP